MVSFKLIICVALIAFASAQDYDGDFDSESGGPDMGGFDGETGFDGGMSGNFGGPSGPGESFEGGAGGSPAFGGEARTAPGGPYQAAASSPLVYKILANH